MLKLDGKAVTFKKEALSLFIMENSGNSNVIVSFIHDIMNIVSIYKLNQGDEYRQAMTKNACIEANTKLT